MEAADTREDTVQPRFICQEGHKTFIPFSFFCVRQRHKQIYLYPKELLFSATAFDCTCEKGAKTRYRANKQNLRHTKKQD